MNAAEYRGRQVARLLPLAMSLPARVRDDDPEANARWLRSHDLTATDYRDLSILLAAHVPDDRSVAELTQWLLLPMEAA